MVQDRSYNVSGVTGLLLLLQLLLHINLACHLEEFMKRVGPGARSYFKATENPTEATHMSPYSRNKL